MHIEVYGFFFILLLGTIGHFSFEWSKHNCVAKYFFAINESTWEHMKLVVLPSVLWFLIELLFIGNNPNLLAARCISLIVMLAFIPLFFYGYQLLIKDNFFLDIIDFILAVAMGQLVDYLMLNISPISIVVQVFLVLIVCTLIFMFLYYSHEESKCPIMTDPITKSSGLKAHKALDKYYAKKRK